MSTLGDFIALQRCFASNNKDILQRKRYYQEPQKGLHLSTPEDFLDCPSHSKKPIWK